MARLELEPVELARLTPLVRQTRASCCGCATTLSALHSRPASILRLDMCGSCKQCRVTFSRMPLDIAQCETSAFHWCVIVRCLLHCRNSSSFVTSMSLCVLISMLDGHSSLCVVYVIQSVSPFRIRRHFVSAQERHSSPLSWANPRFVLRLALAS